jgi:hypothetical protein
VSLRSEESILAAAKRYGIPDHLAHGIMRHVVYGLQPGSGISALLSNNLIDFACKADRETIGITRELALLLIQLPRECLGTFEEQEEYRAERRAKMNV